MISIFYFLFRQNGHYSIIAKMFEYFTRINSLATLRNPLNTKIYIGPDNRIFILRKDYRTAEQDSTIFDQNGFYLFSWISHFCFSKIFLRVDPKIIQQARRILELKDLYLRRENEKNHFENRFSNIEQQFDKIMQIIKQKNKNYQIIQNCLSNKHNE